jgi:hypothetical protein
MNRPAMDILCNGISGRITAGTAVFRSQWRATVIAVPMPCGRILVHRQGDAKASHWLCGI